MKHTEDIARVLCDPSFYEEFAMLEDHQDIIRAVQSRVPEATGEEIDAMLSEVSERLNAQSGEADDILTEDDLEHVAGGIVVTVAVIGAVVKCLTISATVGGIIGGAIWYWKNRKNL